MERIDIEADYSAHMPVEVTQTLVSSGFGGSPIGISRARSDERDTGETAPYELHAAYLVVLQLRPFAEQDLWLEGRAAPHVPMGAGSVCIYDLDRRWVSNLRDSFDCLHFHVPQTSLDDAMDDLDVRRPARRLHCPPHLSVVDPTVHHLGQALLPALLHPERAPRLFVDHVALALHAHFAQSYGGLRLPVPRVERRLAPWQERRVKDLLLARLDGDVPLATLAQECRLSRSYFVRAFRETTGLPPHRWLIRQRVVRAQDYLATSALPLADIALLCGFADQSHFTRTFSRLVGASPSAWRRSRRQK